MNFQRSHLKILSPDVLYAGACTHAHTHTYTHRAQYHEGLHIHTHTHSVNFQRSHLDILSPCVLHTHTHSSVSRGTTHTHTHTHSELPEISPRDPEPRCAAIHTHTQSSVSRGSTHTHTHTQFNFQRSPGMLHTHTHTRCCPALSPQKPSSLGSIPMVLWASRGWAEVGEVTPAEVTFRHTLEAFLRTRRIPERGWLFPLSL